MEEEDVDFVSVGGHNTKTKGKEHLSAFLRPTRLSNQYCSPGSFIGSSNAKCREQTKDFHQETI